jgi:cytochrome P450
MAAVAASGKSHERAALAVVVTEIGSALDELPGEESAHALFARVAAAWADEPTAQRAPGVACDVALIHVASMSNLFAALGWMLIDLLTHRTELSRVRAGDRAWAEKCALESTRLAQRSIMARYVTQPVSLDVGDARHEVGAGATIATLLPLTNTSAAPGLERWDPGRWNRRRLGDPSALAAVELVTAFGHGRHTCPAQPFSLSAMTAAATRLCSAFDLQPAWTGSPAPVPNQIGGVARAAGRCPVRYRRL